MESPSDTFRKELVTYQKYLMNVAMNRVCKVPDAKDLVQRTFVKALENEGNFQPGSNMKAWLTTILVRLCITDYRNTKRRNRSLEMNWHPIDWAPPAQEPTLELKNVLRALDTMPETYREAVIENAINGEVRGRKSLDGSPPRSSVFKSNVKRGRDKLKVISNWER